MFDTNALYRLDHRMTLIIMSLMVVSLVVISATSYEAAEGFFTPLVKSQLRWFIISWGVYFFFTCLDYRRFRELTWILYVIMIISLLGLFFVAPIHNVRRWYRASFLPLDIQPSEAAKLIVILALSWYLEKKRSDVHLLRTAAGAGLIVLIPFALIFKQPDLGTALILYPLTLVMFYFGGVHKTVVKWMSLAFSGRTSLCCGHFFGIYFARRGQTLRYQSHERVSV